MNKWSLLLLLAAGAMWSQVKPTAEVVFSSTGIKIGRQTCFNYKKEGNHFTISDLNGKPLFVGEIRKNVLGKFESSILFVATGQLFHNPKIVGRNDLIFALVEYGVVKNCELDLPALQKFYAARNTP